VNINAGTYNFGIYAAAGGWNINWWRITRVGGRQDVHVDNQELPVRKVSSVYPNPAMGDVTVEADDNAPIRITGMNGKQVYIGRTSDGKVDVRSLQPGIYNVSTLENGKTVNHRLVIQH
jgi:hypothetical protein